MGQKVDPRSLRLQVSKNWRSKWFAARDFGAQLTQDLLVRQAMAKHLGKRAAVSDVEIERSSGQLIITIRTGKPGIVIGRGGAGIEALRGIVAKMTDQQVKLNVEEVKRPELIAQLVADNVASQLERRMAFRRVLRMAQENTIRAGAKGIKVSVAGRLNGADIARRETVSNGSVPLHTIRADIDFAKALAHTTFGVIGVKVWINKGEKF